MAPSARRRSRMATHKHYCISSIIFYERTSLAFAFSEEEKLKAKSPKKSKSSYHFWSQRFLLFVLEKNRFSKFFVCSLCSLLCFFSLSRFALNFFFFGELVAFFFNNKRNHIRLLIKTDERKEGKDFETFLSLFFPLFDTNNTTLDDFYTKAEKTNTRCSFYSSSVL